MNTIFPNVKMGNLKSCAADAASARKSTVNRMRMPDATTFWGRVRSAMTLADTINLGQAGQLAVLQMGGGAIDMGADFNNTSVINGLEGVGASLAE